jgi:hypothetical protein
MKAQMMKIAGYKMKKDFYKAFPQKQVLELSMVKSLSRCNMVEMILNYMEE